MSLKRGPIVALQKSSINLDVGHFNVDDLSHGTLLSRLISALHMRALAIVFTKTPTAQLYTEGVRAMLQEIGIPGPEFDLTPPFKPDTPVFLVNHADASFFARATLASLREQTKRWSKARNVLRGDLLEEGTVFRVPLLFKKLLSCFNEGGRGHPVLSVAAAPPPLPELAYGELRQSPRTVVYRVSCEDLVAGIPLALAICGHRHVTAHVVRLGPSAWACAVVLRYRTVLEADRVRRALLPRVLELGPDAHARRMDAVMPELSMFRPPPYERYTFYEHDGTVKAFPVLKPATVEIDANEAVLELLSPYEQTTLSETGVLPPLSLAQVAASPPDVLEELTQKADELARALKREAKQAAAAEREKADRQRRLAFAAKEAATATAMTFRLAAAPFLCHCMPPGILFGSPLENVPPPSAVASPARAARVRRRAVLPSAREIEKVNAVEADRRRERAEAANIQWSQALSKMKRRAAPVAVEEPVAPVARARAATVAIPTARRKVRRETEGDVLVGESRLDGLVRSLTNPAETFYAQSGHYYLSAGCVFLDRRVRHQDPLEQVAEAVLSGARGLDIEPTVPGIVGRASAALNNILDEGSAVVEDSWLTSAVSAARVDSLGRQFLARGSTEYRGMVGAHAGPDSVSSSGFPVRHVCGHLAPLRPHVRVAGEPVPPTVDVASVLGPVLSKPPSLAYSEWCAVPMGVSCVRVAPLHRLLTSVESVIGETDQSGREKSDRAFVLLRSFCLQRRSAASYVLVNHICRCALANCITEQNPEPKKAASRSLDFHLIHNSERALVALHRPPRFRPFELLPSRIHGVGLFARFSRPAATVGEKTPLARYVGDLVGHLIADRREALYEKLSMGSFYLFEQTDLRAIVDATFCGGPEVTRFINHSCEPLLMPRFMYGGYLLGEGDYVRHAHYNVFKETDPLADVAQIGFFHGGRLPIGSELTFNYNMHDAMACFCLAPRCRGRMIPQDNMTWPLFIREANKADKARHKAK